MKSFYKFLRIRIFNLLPWLLMGFVYRMITGEISCKRNFRRNRVGSGSYVDPSVQIIGWNNITLGSNVTISEECWLNVNHRTKGVERIVIGNNSHIGRRNFFSAGTIIDIKDYAFTGLDCKFLGCGHDTSDPLKPYIQSGLTSGADIKIGVNCWLSTSVTVFQGVSIGQGTVIGAGSMVFEDIPPFSIAVGNPCRVIKRYDFISKAWLKIEDWTDEMNESVPNESDYLALLKQNYEHINSSLIPSSREFGWIQ